VILPLLLIAGCDDRPRQWDAFVYPDMEGSESHETIAGFKTFELCRSAALARIAQLPNPTEAGYDCGYMCGYNPRSQSRVCKETRD
jgi:hypothetical protein